MGYKPLMEQSLILLEFDNNFILRDEKIFTIGERVRDNLLKKIDKYHI